MHNHLPSHFSMIKPMESTWRRIDHAAGVTGRRQTLLWLCVFHCKSCLSCRVLQRDRVLHNSLALSFIFSDHARLDLC